MHKGVKSTVYWCISVLVNKTRKGISEGYEDVQISDIFRRLCDAVPRLRLGGCHCFVVITPTVTNAQKGRHVGPKISEVRYFLHVTVCQS